MKLLLDECVTRFVSRDLVGHDVHTVDEAGFKGLENGDLLRAASGVYDALITVDQNLPYQQNIAGLNIAIVVLAAKTKQLRTSKAPYAESVSGAANNNPRPSSSHQRIA